MKTDLMKKASPLMLAFALAACANSYDLARKPNLAEPIVQAALQKCEIRPGDEGYAMRMRKVLMDTRTASLEVLSFKNVTICLDGRLEKQEPGFLGAKMLGKLYNKDAAKPVISLFDNGKVGSQGSFWKLNTDDWGGETLNALAKFYKDKENTARQGDFYAGLYNYPVGKSSFIKIEWRDSKNFDQVSIAKNPQLNTPPLRASSSKHGMQ